MPKDADGRRIEVGMGVSVHFGPVKVRAKVVGVGRNYVTVTIAGKERRYPANEVHTQKGLTSKKQTGNLRREERRGSRGFEQIGEFYLDQWVKVIYHPTNKNVVGKLAFLVHFQNRETGYLIHYSKPQAQAWSFPLEWLVPADVAGGNELSLPGLTQRMMF